MSALRAYDSDFVSANSVSALELAMEIASSYTGNWDDMCGMKSRCQDAEAQGLLIDAKTARSVLNMALGSGALESLWGWRIRHVLSGCRHRNSRADGPDLQVVRQSPIIVPPEPQRRKVTLSVRARINTRYAMSDVKNAVAHLPDPLKTHIRWDAPFIEYTSRDYDYEHRVPVLWAHWLCGKYTHTQKGGGYGRSMLFFDEIPEGRRACRRCLDVEAERNATV